MLDSLPAVTPKEIMTVFPTAPTEAIEFLKACFQFNPKKRITAHAALRHPFLAQFHNPAAEPESPVALRISVDDNTKYTAADYRERLYQDIARRKKASVAKKAAAGAQSAAPKTGEKPAKETTKPVKETTSA